MCGVCLASQIGIQSLNVKCSIERLRMLLMTASGALKHGAPLLDFRIDGVVLNARASRDTLGADVVAALSLYYMNHKLLGWEPFLEPWTCRCMAEVQTIADDFQPGAVVDMAGAARLGSPPGNAPPQEAFKLVTSIRSSGKLDLNVTEAAFEAMAVTAQSFGLSPGALPGMNGRGVSTAPRSVARRAGTHRSAAFPEDSVDRPSARAAGTSLYVLRNQIGVPINFSPGAMTVDKSDLADGAERAIDVELWHALTAIRPSLKVELTDDHRIPLLWYLLQALNDQWKDSTRRAADEAVHGRPLVNMHLAELLLLPPSDDMKRINSSGTPGVSGGAGSSAPNAGHAITMGRGERSAKWSRGWQPLKNINLQTIGTRLYPLSSVVEAENSRRTPGTLIGSPAVSPHNNSCVVVETYPVGISKIIRLRSTFMIRNSLPGYTLRIKLLQWNVVYGSARRGDREASIKGAVRGEKSASPDRFNLRLQRSKTHDVVWSTFVQPGDIVSVPPPFCDIDGADYKYRFELVEESAHTPVTPSSDRDGRLGAAASTITTTTTGSSSVASTAATPAGTQTSASAAPDSVPAYSYDVHASMFGFQSSIGSWLSRSVRSSSAAFRDGAPLRDKRRPAVHSLLCFREDDAAVTRSRDIRRGSRTVRRYPLNAHLQNDVDSDSDNDADHAAVDTRTGELRRHLRMVSFHSPLTISNRLTKALSVSISTPISEKLRGRTASTQSMQEHQPLDVPPAQRLDCLQFAWMEGLVVRFQVQGFEWSPPILVGEPPPSTAGRGVEVEASRAAAAADGLLQDRQAAEGAKVFSAQNVTRSGRTRTVWLPIDDKTASVQLRIGVQVRRSACGGLRISVFAPFFVYNRTHMPLLFRHAGGQIIAGQERLLQKLHAEGDERQQGNVLSQQRPPGLALLLPNSSTATQQSKLPLLMDYSDNRNSRAAVQVRVVPDTSWSTGIDLDQAAPGTRVIEVREETAQRLSDRQSRRAISSPSFIGPSAAASGAVWGQKNQWLRRKFVFGVAVRPLAEIGKHVAESMAWTRARAAMLAARTKVVVVSPRYVLINSASRDIVVKQTDTHDSAAMSLRMGQRRAFHWPSDACPSSIRIRCDELGWLWSGCLKLDMVRKGAHLNWPSCEILCVAVTYCRVSIHLCYNACH